MVFGSGFGVAVWLCGGAAAVGGVGGESAGIGCWWGVRSGEGWDGILESWDGREEVLLVFVVFFYAFLGWL